MLSLFGKLFAYIGAKYRGVPYSVEGLWPPSYTTFGKGKKYNGDLEVVAFSGRGSVGDLVGVFRRGDTRYIYEITGRTCASGSDHIVSPFSYDLRYVGCMTESDFQSSADTAPAPALLSLW